MTAVAIAVQDQLVPRTSWWRKLRRRRGLLIGSAVLALLVVPCALAGLVAPYGPASPDYNAVLHPPTATHWLGTDEFGRDILSRLLYGGRISLSIAAAGTLISAAAGSVIGLLAGYFGGVLDLLVMRVMDVALAFPGYLIAVGIVALIGPGTVNVLIAIGVFGVPTFARLVRGETLRIRELLFVEAAHALGASSTEVMKHHVLPNVVPLLAVYAPLRIASAILIASGLSFLGLGVQPPTAEWGLMLSDGRGFLNVAGWMTLFPGCAILLATLSLNLIGEGLRAALDPTSADD